MARIHQGLAPRLLSVLIKCSCNQSDASDPSLSLFLRFSPSRAQRGPSGSHSLAGGCGILTGIVPLDEEHRRNPLYRLTEAQLMCGKLALLPWMTRTVCVSSRGTSPPRMRRLYFHLAAAARAVGSSCRACRWPCQRGGRGAGRPTSTGSPACGRIGTPAACCGRGLVA